MFNTRSAFTFLITCIFAGTLTTPAWAAESERQFGPWVWGLQGGAVHQFDADLSDADGDFNVSRGFLQGSLGYAWDRRTSVSLSVGAGGTNYDFSSEATIDGRQPWDEIEDYRISLPVRFSPSERSDVIIIPSVRTNAESGASLNDGRTEGVLVGMSWKFSDSLSIGPGLGWFSELGGGSNAFPIVVIDWQITEKLSLNTGRGLAASQGPGVTLNYEFAKKWTLGLTGRYEKTRFVLDEDDLGADGIGEDQSLPLLLVLNYSPWPMTNFTAILGAEFEGSLKIEDDNGRSIADSDFETAPVIGVSFSARF